MSPRLIIKAAERFWRVDPAPGNPCRELPRAPGS